MVPMAGDDRSNVWGFDLETHLVKPGMLVPRMVCLTWASATDTGIMLRFEALAWLHRRLTDGSILVGHNITYDLAVACAEDESLIPLIFAAYEAGRIRCTEVQQYLIDIARGEGAFRRTRGQTRKANTSLKELVWHWKGQELPKEGTWRLRYHELDGKSLEEWPDEAIMYPLRDAREAYDIDALQRTYAFGAATPWTAKQVPPLNDAANQNRAAWALHLASVWGVRTDPTKVHALEDALEAEHNSAVKILQKDGIVRADGTTDTKLLRARVVAAYAAIHKEVPRTPPSKKFPDGQVQISAAVLNATSDGGLLVKGALHECENIRSNWLLAGWGGLRSGTQVPICARYKPVLETGRVSCSQPNMMNPPRGGGVRDCFVPRPGWVFAGADYDTLELRTLAQACLEMVGWSALADALNAGADPHLGLAAVLMGISDAEAARLYAEGDKNVEDWRQLCKIANFGFPGGMVPLTFQEYAEGYGRVITLDVAKRLYAGWHKRWPEMDHYFKRIKAMLPWRGRGTIVQLQSLRVRGDVGFCQAANTFFQGRAADGAKEALWRVAKEQYTGVRTDGRPGVSPLYGCRTVIFMHDEIIMEVPEATATHRLHGAGDAGERLGQVMVEAMSKWVPNVLIKASPVLMRSWKKGAKPVRNAAGVLVPGRPETKDGKTKWVEDGA
jgi:DNA polymerase-1